VIQTALISEAELIITGDEDLLSLVKVDSIRIISVKEAVALLAAS
jgi:predicted nucleic acid-binding protein